MRSFPVLLLLAALALAGCSGDSGVVPDQDAQGRYVIHLTADNRFEPAEARVPVGATVVWLVDGGAHDINEEEDRFSSFDTGEKDANGYPVLLQPGQSWNHTFAEAGKFTYWCHTHHEYGMKGVLTVED